jgi:hypothetical protein
MTTGNDVGTVTIGETSYRVSRQSTSGIGVIAVHGDQIEFSGSNLCEGTGTYRWQITDGKLTFTPVGTRDPCARIDVLEGHTFTPLHPG